MQTNSKEKREHILAQIRMLMYMVLEMHDTDNLRRAMEIEVIIDDLRNQYGIHEAELFPHNDR